MSHRWLAGTGAVAVSVAAFTVCMAWRGRTSGLLLPALPHTSLALLFCASGDPTQARTLHVDGFGPPASWREAVAEADAVVVGRRDTNDPQEVTLETCYTFTLYSFVTVEAIKGSVPGRRLDVSWFGRKIDEVEGFPRPKLGELYLMFLQRARSSTYYYPMHGPYATFPIAFGKNGPQIGLLDNRGPGVGLLLEGGDFLAALRRYAQAN